MEQTKRCSKCQEVKPIDNFGFNKRTRDGHQCWCRNCHKIADKIRLAKLSPEDIQQRRDDAKERRATAQYKKYHATYERNVREDAFMKKLNAAAKVLNKL